eukprot:SAG31_NODE_10828_length_1093_cov_0.993964_1_plen_281_part_00
MLTHERRVPSGTCDSDCGPSSSSAGEPCFTDADCFFSSCRCEYASSGLPQCPTVCLTCQAGGAADGGVELAPDESCREFCSPGGYCGRGGCYVTCGRHGNGVDCSSCAERVVTIPTDDDSGLSGVALAAIIVGSMCCCVCLFCMVIVFTCPEKAPEKCSTKASFKVCKKRRQPSPQPASSPAPAHHATAGPPPKHCVSTGPPSKYDVAARLFAAGPPPKHDATTGPPPKHPHDDVTGPPAKYISGPPPKQPQNDLCCTRPDGAGDVPIPKYNASRRTSFG